MDTKWIVSLMLGLCLAGWGAGAGAGAVQQFQPEKAGSTPTVDYDKDGKVSLAEHLAWEESLFITNDLDGDGYITNLEVAEIQMKRVLDMQEAGDLVLTEEELTNLISLKYTFSETLDTDRNGKVSLKEHLAWETANFNGRDLNKDGFITMDELEPETTAKNNTRAGAQNSQAPVIQQAPDSGQTELTRQNYQDN